MTKIVSLVNNKGGVGKTTTVANVGSILSHQGYKVLMVDLDAQCNLTKSLSKNLGAIGRTINEAFVERKDLPVYGDGKMDIVPSSPLFSSIDMMMAGTMFRESILKDLLDDKSNYYDVILLDCPPLLGLSTFNAFVASTDVIVPLIPEALPFYGLETINYQIEQVSQKINKGIKLSGIVLTRWKPNNLYKGVEEQTAKVYGDIMFKTKIRENIEIAKSPLHGEGIIYTNPKCNGAKDYLSLTEEIKERLTL